MTIDAIVETLKEIECRFGATHDTDNAFVSYRILAANILGKLPEALKKRTQ